jgi:hypothetical protein
MRKPALVFLDSRLQSELDVQVPPPHEQAHGHDPAPHYTYCNAGPRPVQAHHKGSRECDGDEHHKHKAKESYCTDLWLAHACAIQLTVCQTQQCCNDRGRKQRGRRIHVRVKPTTGFSIWLEVTTILSDPGLLGCRPRPANNREHSTQSDEVNNRFAYQLLEHVELQKLQSLKFRPQRVASGYGVYQIGDV